VLGRELFDYAFKQYSQRWMFKQPMPADFFRTMEDASGTDLDWFWRGWFYTTDHVDIELADVQVFQVNTRNPELEKPMAAKQKEARGPYIGDVRNQEQIEQTVMERDPDLQDFYNSYDPSEVTLLDELAYRKYMDALTEEEKALLESDKFYYQLTFKNIGGLVMPLILRFTYADGSEEIKQIPAEIWRYNSGQVSKVFLADQEIVSIELDPFRQLADTDVSNNNWPYRPQPTRFEVFKRRSSSTNPMQIQQRVEELRKQGSGQAPSAGGNK
ncbi:MAG: M1 family peptidase, partial [Bacteroidota bacterium]